MTNNVNRLPVILACAISVCAALDRKAFADPVEQASGGERLTSAALEPTPAPLPKSSNKVSPAKLVQGPDEGADANDLGNAARITLNFRGYPDLSRDYRVSADGTVSVPVIGRLNVSSLTPSSLEEALATRMSAVSGTEAYVTVEVAEYRPIFVTGYVTKPDASAWHPGMTVLQAIATAGGVFRAPDMVAGTSSLAVDLERTRIKTSANDLKISIATLARLRAEQTGATTIPIPPELVSLVGAGEARTLIDTQTILMQSRASADRDQLAAIERGEELARSELEGLTSQSTTIRKLLDTRRAYKNQIEGLQTRAPGIVIASRNMEEDIKVSDLEEKRVNIAVATARILGTIAFAQRDAVKLRLDRRSSIEADIAHMEHDVSQFAIELDAAKNSYTKLTGELAPSTNHKSNEIDFSIVRRVNGNMSTIVATQGTALRPGDVLVVTASQ